MYASCLPHHFYCQASWQFDSIKLIWDILQNWKDGMKDDFAGVGYPYPVKYWSIPHLTLIPIYEQELVPPPPRFNFDQNYCRKLYLMFRIPNQIVTECHFGFSRIFFPSPPFNWCCSCTGTANCPQNAVLFPLPPRGKNLDILATGWQVWLGMIKEAPVGNFMFDDVLRDL